MKFYDEHLLNCRPRILVTAPSNKAVDEIMKKVGSCSRTLCVSSFEHIGAHIADLPR